ncbi:MAG: TonB-dependent receptor [Campylobacterales bacterium]|nr:TonB-dependent receptor [Campylobacterales bacterium]
MTKKIAFSLVAAVMLETTALADSEKLGKLTVTAQKYEEDPQDIPMSLTVVDEFTIDDKGITTVEDLGKVTPSFSFMGQGTSGVGSPTMRGIHGDFHNFSTPIPVIVDGVPLLNGLGFNTLIEDVERVEVLKGPQGTLYGKNAEVGVINIVSKKPDNNTKAKAVASFGSDNKKEYLLSASGPIVDNKFYVGLTYNKYSKDGFIKNKVLDKTVGKRENDYGKLYLRATPSENLDISLISSVIKNNDGDAHIGLSTKREVNSDIESYNKAKTVLHTLKVDYSFGDMKLESISAYKKYTDDAAQDWDFSQVPGTNYEFHERRTSDNYFTTQSQEFRLSSRGETLKWLTGLYLDKDNVHFESNINGNPFHSEHIDSDSLGLFAHGDYQVSEKLSVLTGLRLDKDTKKITKPFVKENKYSQVSPKLALNYKHSANQLSYINVAKGYRAGGYNASSPSQYPRTFDQEELLSYELGMKNRLLDDKLKLNFAIYHMDIIDMQVKSAVSPSWDYTTNAGKAVSQGVEVDGDYTFTDSLAMFFSGSMNKNEFKEFKSDNFDNSNNLTGTLDLSGKQNIYSPKYNYNLGVSYRSGGGYFARFDVSGFGEMYSDKENENKVSSYNLYDGKIGFESENFDIHLYGKNLFDKKHDIEKYSGYLVVYSPPKEIGLSAAYRF